jgi:hypothetical protein
MFDTYIQVSLRQNFRSSYACVFSTIDKLRFGHWFQSSYDSIFEILARSPTRERADRRLQAA